MTPALVPVASEPAQATTKTDTPQKQRTIHKVLRTPQEMDQPMPFVAEMPGGLYPSKKIVVSGIALPSAERLQINLYSGNDIALHLDIRFRENVVVCNTKMNGIWGSEERSPIEKMPFIPGQRFSVCITCEADYFRVDVNGGHLCEYYHKLKNLSSINKVEVVGDTKEIEIQM